MNGKSDLNSVFRSKKYVYFRPGTVKVGKYSDLPAPVRKCNRRVQKLVFLLDRRYNHHSSQLQQGKDRLLFAQLPIIDSQTLACLLSLSRINSVLYNPHTVSIQESSPCGPSQLRDISAESSSKKYHPPLTCAFRSTLRVRLSPF